MRFPYLGTHILQRGSNSSINGQCGGCRLSATLRDLESNKPYSAGYLKPVECLIDPDIGIEMLLADDLRLRLSHHDIRMQGEMIEIYKEAVRNGSEQKVRLEDLKGATGCRGKLTPITLLTYTEAYAFREYPVRIAWL